MAQSRYSFNLKLPSGGALEWDMTMLNDEQLAHEHSLSYQSLYGHTHKGEIILKGLLDPEYKKSAYISEDQLVEAKRVWKLRFKRAEDELERRFLS